MEKFSNDELSLSQITRLGLAGTIAASADASVVDYTPLKAKSIENISANVENFTPLRFFKPRYVLKRDIAAEKFNLLINSNKYQYFESKTTCWRSWKNSIENEYFYTKYKVADFLQFNISFVDLSYEKYNAADNNFFKPFNIDKLKKAPSNQFYTARFRFPKDFSNTYELAIQTASGELLTRPNGIHNSGQKQQIYTNKTYYKWHKNLTQFPLDQYTELQNLGNNGNLNNFYIPYPNTLDIEHFNPFNVPVSLSVKPSHDPQKIYGLLVISTGTATNKEIVYVSPHGYETGFFNTVEEFEYTTLQNIEINKGSKYKRFLVTGAIPSGFNGIYKERISRSKNGSSSFLALDYFSTGDENYVPKEIYKNYDNYWVISGNDTMYVSSLPANNLESVTGWNPTYNNTEYYNAEYPTTINITNANFKFSKKIEKSTNLIQVKGISIDSYHINGGEVLPYNGEFLKQETPLKDTLFYRFYKKLYNKNKTIATGTWDGIIPSGASFSIEIISTFFDEYFGLSHNLGIYYAGENQEIISKIQNAFNAGAISGLAPKIKVDENLDEISYTAHAVNKNFHESKMQAKRIARKKLRQKLTSATKIIAPEILYKNKKYIKMENFIYKKYGVYNAPYTENTFNTLNIPSGNFIIQS